MKLIEKLKEKPAHVKTNIALGGAIAVTLAIAFVWVTTIPARFGSITASVNTISEKGETAAAENGLTDLLDGLKENTETLKANPPLTEGGVPRAAGVETGALDSLSGWNTNTATQTSPTGTDGAPVLEDRVDEEPTNSPLMPLSQASGTPELKPEPKVILIGTTTNKTP